MPLKKKITVSWVRHTQCQREANCWVENDFAEAQSDMESSLADCPLATERGYKHAQPVMHIHTCTNTHTHVHTCIHACTHKTYICAHTHAHTCIPACTHTNIHMCSHIHTQTYTHTCIHACTHIHTHEFVYMDTLDT